MMRVIRFLALSGASDDCASDADAAPAHSDNGRTSCPGCRAHPSPDCAACGAPACVFLPADALHSLSLCAACFTIIRACRADAASQRQRTRAYQPTRPTTARGGAA